MNLIFFKNKENRKVTLTPATAWTYAVVFSLGIIVLLLLGGGLSYYLLLTTDTFLPENEVVVVEEIDTALLTEVANVLEARKRNVQAVMDQFSGEEPLPEEEVEDETEVAEEVDEGRGSEVPEFSI